MVKKWFITGGCGFIGTSLINRLVKDNPKSHIIVFDNLSAGTYEDLAEVANISNKSHTLDKQGVYLINDCITNYNSLFRTMAGCDCVVHLAANTGVQPSIKNPRNDFNNNVLGTFNLLESSRHHVVKKFIFASSGAPAGSVEPPIHEELAPHPMSPYGASKLAGEGYCSAYYNSYKINTISLRFGNVYGPRSKNKNSVIAKFIKQAFNNETCIVHGDGNQTRDFIYIDDLVESIILSSQSHCGGETFQIASGYERTINEAAIVIQQKIKALANIDMKIDHDSPLLGDVKRNFSNTSKAESMLKWKAKENFSSGISKTINYFSNKNK